MDKEHLDEIKFHWTKWKDESRSFWGRATFMSLILLLSILFQFGMISVNFSWIVIYIPRNPWWMYFFVNMMSWFLLLFLFFKFVDLLRHRVPDKFEQDIHNNEMTVGVRLPLKLVGRFLYGIFPVYFLVIGATLVRCSLMLLQGQIPIVPVMPGPEVWKNNKGLSIGETLRATRLKPVPGQKKATDQLPEK